MSRSKKFIVASLVTGLITNPAGPRAYAQEDMPPPPDFGDSFPPPPPGGSDFGDSTPSGGGSANGRSSGGSTPGATGGVLTKAQQDKFNRSGSEDINNQNFPETIESFDFPNVEITDVIKTISELTGKNFIIDPGVRGKITIIAPSKITVAEAYKAFLSSLAINGYTVVPSGSFLKVKNARNAQRDSIETYSGAYYPNDDQMITRIIHLKHISAEIVNRELRILPSKDGEMSIYSPTNSIILSDYGSNIDRVMKIINQLDIPGFEEQIDVVRVRHAKSKDMAELIDKIVNKGQKSTTGPMGGAPGTFSSGVPRFSRTGSTGGTQGQSGNSFFMAIPDERSNSIIIVGNKSGILRVKKLLSQLDFPIRPDEAGGVYVYYVKHGDAEKIATVLQGVAKEAAPKPGTGPAGFPNMGFGAPIPGQTTEGQVFGGDVKITADKNTNSLVVTASKQDYDRVLNLLGKIDIPRDQVFVEATIMEMAVNDTFEYKIGFYQYGEGGSPKAGFNGGLDLVNALNPLAGSGAILPFGQGKNVTITEPTTGKTTTVKSLTGFLTLVKGLTRTNVLSNPQITAMDNEEATIEVGQKVATSISNSQTTTGQTTQTANFEEATIKLKIKPFISPASNSIRMEIDQSVKQATDPVGPKAITENTIALATRSIKTNIVVGNGDTAILGGLIKDEDGEQTTKVPLLGDLPIIGWLFKSKNTRRQKMNLVVFLTPKIIRTPADSQQIVSHKLNQRLDFIKSTGGRDPYGAALEEMQNRNNFKPSPILDRSDLKSGASSNIIDSTPAPAPRAQMQDLPKPPLAPVAEDDIEDNPTPEVGAGPELDFEPGNDEGVDPALTE
jgi:general secretion pathway protein D